MAIKGVFLPAHGQINKFRFSVPGLPAFTPVSITGIEKEIETTELPDKTIATGGRQLPLEFELALAAHHDLEIAAMDVWQDECEDPVDPLHKKVATLDLLGQSGRVVRSYMLPGCFPPKLALPDFELDNEGEMAQHSYTMRADELIRIV